MNIGGPLTSPLIFLICHQCKKKKVYRRLNQVQRYSKRKLSYFLHINFNTGEMENVLCLWGMCDERALSRGRKASSVNLFRVLCGSEGAGWHSWQSCWWYAKLTHQLMTCEGQWICYWCSDKLQEALTVFVVYLCFSATLFFFHGQIVEPQYGNNQQCV